MMAAVSRDTTEGIDIPAEFQAYHSLGIPQCAIKFYWDKNKHDLEHTRIELNEVLKNSLAKDKPNPCPLQADKPVHCSCHYSTANNVTGNLLPYDFYRPPPAPSLPPSFNKSISDHGKIIKEPHVLWHQSSEPSDLTLASYITANDAVTALQDCKFRVNQHWEMLLTRLGLEQDLINPLRQAVGMGGEAYNGLTRGIDAVIATKQRVTQKILIDAVRGIGENVTADQLKIHFLHPSN